MQVFAFIVEDTFEGVRGSQLYQDVAKAQEKLLDFAESEEACGWRVDHRPRGEFGIVQEVWFWPQGETIYHSHSARVEKRYVR